MCCHVDDNSRAEETRVSLHDCICGDGPGNGRHECQFVREGCKYVARTYTHTSIHRDMERKTDAHVHNMLAC